MQTLPPPILPIRIRNASRQQGVTLIITLLMLVVITLLALSTSRLGSQQEQIARALRFRSIAYDYANAALNDGRTEIYSVADKNPSLRSSRAELFGNPDNFLANGSNNCGLQLPTKPNAKGLCGPEPSGTRHSWDKYMDTQGVTLGTYAVYPVGGAARAAVVPPVMAPFPAPPTPQYLIEYCKNCIAGPLFRVTARGFGTVGSNTSVWLQSTLRLPDQIKNNLRTPGMGY